MTSTLECVPIDVMKKAIRFFLAIFIFCVSGAFTSQNIALAQTATGIAKSAQADMYPLPIRRPFPNYQNFLGENQNYTLVLRGNGEAVVSFKSILYNPDATSLSDIKIHFSSDVQPQDFTVFQVIQQPYCIRYKPYPLPLAQSQAPTVMQQNSDQNCDQYQDPDYQNLYVGNTSYQKLSANYGNNTLTFSLSTPIQQNKYGSYFVYFRSFAYTHKTLFGGYTYAFQTPKFETKVNNLQIGITTDSDLFLKGTSGKVQYEGVKVSGRMAAMPPVANGMRNPQFDQFYNQIGQGDIVKNASNLQPLETYTVKGLYADSNWKLYGKEITTGIVVSILVIILLFVFLRFLLGKLTKYKEKTSGVSEPMKLFLIAAGLSFLSETCIFLYAVGSFFVLYLIRDSQLAFVVTIFILFLSFAIYMFLLFAAPVGIAIKKGYVWGIICFGLNIFWMMVFLGITIAVLLVFFPQGTDYVTPLRMMGL